MSHEAKKTDNISAFVAHLRELDEQGALGALAALRRSLTDDLGMAASANPHVVPFLARASRRDDPWFFLVGALFASSRLHAPGVTFGAAQRRLDPKLEQPAVAARFTALLDAHPEDLADHLRRAAALLRSKAIGLDWELLLRDLQRVDDPRRSVQRRWARDFWGGADAVPTQDTTDHKETI